MAEAVPRSLAGNHAATMRLLAGKDGASATPTMKRRQNTSTMAAMPVKKPIVPCISVNSDHSRMLKEYTRLEPKRSSSQPPGICAITYAQPKAEKM